MNLYQINFIHYSQKDSQDGIKTFLTAESDMEVYEWVDKNYQYGLFKDMENDEEYLDDVPIKNAILDTCGSMYNEYYLDRHCVDLYYGATFYGWKIIKENVTGREIKNIESIGLKVESTGK